VNGVGQSVDFLSWVSPTPTGTAVFTTFSEVIKGGYKQPDKTGYLVVVRRNEGCHHGTWLIS